jgi:SAM-dependent methyltransferase
MEKVAMTKTLWSASRSRMSLAPFDGWAPSRFAISKFFRSLRRASKTHLSPCRELLVQHILPAVASEGGPVLFVGVRAYTAQYPSLIELHGAECWTIDIDPSVAQHGASKRHVVDSITNAREHFPAATIQSVVMNGLFGFGLNSYRTQLEAIETCAAILRPNGLLVLGWNDRRGHPSALEEFATKHFDYRPIHELEARIWVPGTDHNYAFLRRR